MPQFGMRPLLAMMGLVSKPSIAAAQEAVTGRRLMTLVDKIAASRKVAISPKTRALNKLRDKIDKWCRTYNSKVRTRQAIRHSLRKYYFAQFRQEFDGEIRPRLRLMSRNKMRRTWRDYVQSGVPAWNG